MARTQAAERTASASRLKEFKPYLILGGLTMALIAEVWVISTFSSGQGLSSVKAVTLPSLRGGSSQYHSSTTDETRAEDHTRASDQASIQGNVLNPVESVFSTQEQQQRAEQFGLK